MIRKLYSKYLCNIFKLTFLSSKFICSKCFHVFCLENVEFFFQKYHTLEFRQALIQRGAGEVILTSVVDIRSLPKFPFLLFFFEVFTQNVIGGCDKIPIFSFYSKFEWWMWQNSHYLFNVIGGCVKIPSEFCPLMIFQTVTSLKYGPVGLLFLFQGQTPHYLFFPPPYIFPLFIEFYISF